jgi:7-cyano-7-deazaguanine synthase
MRLIVALSGGMDSATLLYALAHYGHELACLGIDYGQRHVKELACARYLAQERNVNYDLLDLSTLRALIGTSSQTNASIPVPEGHYTDASMKVTVVPNRNMILLAACAAASIARGFDGVAYAAHAGDHTIYPDCRPAFVEAMREAFQHCSNEPQAILAPFLNNTKADICTLGHKHLVPFDHTWSCYKGDERHCGRCGTCVERREAFQLAGVQDPTTYAD